MYSTYNEGKSINNIFKHMTAVSKNVYFDVIGNIAENTITQFTQQ